LVTVASFVAMASAAACAATVSALSVAFFAAAASSAAFFFASATFVAVTPRVGAVFFKDFTLALRAITVSIDSVVRLLKKGKGM
jgi:hypothetical protein